VSVGGGREGLYRSGDDADVFVEVRWIVWW